jgi:hypothetical protein
MHTGWFNNWNPRSIAELLNQAQTSLSFIELSLDTHLITEKNSEIVILRDSNLQRAFQKNHDACKTPNFEIE